MTKSRENGKREWYVDMRSSPFVYRRPSTLAEAISELVAYRGEAKLIAGGQSLMPMLAFRLVAPSCLIDISRLPDLKSVDVDPSGTVIGALVTWHQIEMNRHLAIHHPLLVAAISHVAHYQIRNRGTVGGSLAHADPASELLGIAVTCDAQITIVGVSGERIIAADDFCTGSLTTVLEDDEIVTRLRLPPWPAGRRWAFEEFARRRGDFAIAGVALFYDLNEQGLACDVHLGVIGAGDRPRRLTRVEALLEGRRIDAAVIRVASELAAAAVDPPSDIHAGADYRRDLVSVLVERALARAAGLTMAEAA